MIEFLQAIFAPIFDEPWQAVSRPAQVAWLIFYGGFLDLCVSGARAHALHRSGKSGGS